MPLHNDPFTVRLPYPDSPPRPAAVEDGSYFPQLSALNFTTNLTEAQQTKGMAHRQSVGSGVAADGGGVKLPASLRIGADGGEGSRSPPRGGGEMWMRFQKDEATLPESLRPGAGVVRAKTPEGRRESVSVHGALETDMETNPWSREKGAQEVRMHDSLSNWEEGVRMHGGLPKSLLPGQGAVGQNTQMHGALPASLPAPGGGEPFMQKIPMHGALPASFPVPQPAPFLVPQPASLPATPPAPPQAPLPAPFLAGSGEPDMKLSPSAVHAPSSHSSSPGPRMSANLKFADHPFSEYSPFYVPPTSFTPSPALAAEPPATSTNFATAFPDTEISPRRPSISVTNSASSELKDRQHSIASSVSSAGFEPGVDMSSLDASTARGFPGKRGYNVGMDGWKEDDAEEDIAKTWEEELDRRAKAGAELQRKTEEAAGRYREERLQAEFWEEERRLGAMLVIEGPQKPPKPELPARQPTSESPPVPPPRPPPPPPPPPPAASPMPPPLPARQPPPSATTTTEIYQIKHITWLSPSMPRSSSNIRRSPILLQAANGPCPLLALVNALILSTPVGTTTALISILQVREQVSLELLLDAVFQELMDRGGAAGLPDVGDLFAFLLTLHTGMNVNPRFYRDDDHHYASEYADFEHTREMELYGAFKVPLVHGWLPEVTHPVVTAMKRRKTANYEDAQTLLFVEEEIINRITVGGAELAPGDERIIEDATVIREFMDNSKTQLTSFGLETVRGRLKPGDVAILFRNDHFMTVIGARDGTALHGLVTDAGFATHEEVVWERMVDVQGRNNEFLSGDFRPVGGQQPQGESQQRAQQRPVQSLLDPDGVWETIPDSIANEQPRTIGSRLDAGLPGLESGPDPDATGHDADLALAMMLQEEEDEQHRRAQEARQRARLVPQPLHYATSAVPTHMGHPLGQVPPPPPPRGRGAGQVPQTHRPADLAETTPPPPYERVPTRPAPTTYTQHENMSAYQSMTQQQQQQQQQQQAGWPMQGGHGRSASTPGGGGAGLTSVQRQQAARGLLQEIAGSAGARRNSGGTQGGQSGPGGPPGSGRRQSISGQDDKEKCVVC